MMALAIPPCWRYGLPVTVNPVADLGRSNSNRRTSAQHHIAGAFLRPHYRVMAAVRGTPSGVPGPYCPGRPTRVLLPPHSLGRERWQLQFSNRSFTHDHL